MNKTHRQLLLKNEIKISTQTIELKYKVKSSYFSIIAQCARAKQKQYFFLGKTAYSHLYHRELFCLKRIRRSKIYYFLEHSLPSNNTKNVVVKVMVPI